MAAALLAVARDELRALAEAADRAASTCSASAPLAEALRAEVERELFLLETQQANLASLDDGAMQEEEEAFLRKVEALRASAGQALALLEEALGSQLLEASSSSLSAPAQLLPAREGEAEQDLHQRGVSACEGETDRDFLRRGVSAFEAETEQDYVPQGISARAGEAERDILRRGVSTCEAKQDCLRRSPSPPPSAWAQAAPSDAGAADAAAGAVWTGGGLDVEGRCVQKLHVAAQRH